MAMWDHLPAAEAVARAWTDPGPAYGTWHKLARADVEYVMPLLARALDRLVDDLADVLPGDYDRLLWGWPEGIDPRESVRTDRLRHAVRGRR